MDHKDYHRANELTVVCFKIQLNSDLPTNKWNESIRSTAQIHFKWPADIDVRGQNSDGPVVGF